VPWVRYFLYLRPTHNKAGVPANYQAGDISRRKEVKEKRPSPFFLRFVRLQVKLIE
jgi:hypothetical protein